MVSVGLRARASLGSLLLQHKGYPAVLRFLVYHKGNPAVLRFLIYHKGNPAVLRFLIYHKGNPAVQCTPVTTAPQLWWVISQPGKNCSTPHTIMIWGEGGREW